jgi:hypothetical protein
MEKMTVSYGSINTLVLIMILLSCTLYQSNLGGPGSIFNVIGFLLAVGFVCLNFKFNPMLLAGFLFPFVFLLLSVFVNRDVMDNGAYHTAQSISASYLLLTLAPFPLNHALLKRCVIIYLISCLLLSLGFYVDTLLSGQIIELMANENFNGNPNSASMFFLSCLILTLIFTKGWLRWVCMTLFIILVCSTASRAGFFVSMLLLMGFIVSKGSDQYSFNWRGIFSATVFRNTLILMVIIGVIIMLLPEAYKALQTRLSIAGLGLDAKYFGNHGRDEIWRAAFEIAHQSTRTIFFGISSSSVGDVLGSGTHSSYVEAIIALGWPFLLSTLFFIALIFYYHKAKGQDYFIFLGIAILIYGAFETFLFNGMGSLWWLFIFLSFYYRTAPKVIAVNAPPASRMKNAYNY